MGPDTLAKKGLNAKLAGKYQQACQLFQWAYEYERHVRGHERPCFLVDVLMNWADAKRRLSCRPEDTNVKHALDLFRQAFEILRLTLDACPKQAVACIHHYARFERQRGNYHVAYLYNELALRAIRSFVRQRWYSPIVDRVTIALDTASTRALNGRVSQARLAVFEALMWCCHPVYWRRGQVTRAHVGRALILLRNANNPFASGSRIRRAFFGREVMNSE